MDSAKAAAGDDDLQHEEEGSSMLGRATAPRRQARRTRNNGNGDDSDSFLNSSLSMKLVLLVIGAIVVVWFMDHSSSNTQLHNLHAANMQFNAQQEGLLHEKQSMKEQLDKQLSIIDDLTKQVAKKQKASTEAERALAAARESLESLNSSTAEERAALAKKLADAEEAARTASTTPPASSSSTSPATESAPDSNVWVAQRRLRVLVLYAYFKTGNSEPNLSYFLKAGVLPYANDSHVQFVLATSSSLDGMSLPVVPNLAVLQRANAGMDFCGWRQAIDHLKELTDGRVDSIYRYDRVILINGSIRGPFMPSLAGDRWIDLFISPLAHCGATPPLNADGTPGKYTGTCDVAIVGSSINCHKMSNMKDRFMAMHAQSMLLAFPTIYWSELENNLQCWADGGHVFIQGEIGFTWAALKHGHNIAVTSQLWRDWQFKDLDATSKRCRWIAEKSWHQWGDNHCVRCMPEDVTPVGMDLLFIKTNRDIDPSRLHLETKLELDHFEMAYPHVKYTTPNGGIPSTIKFVDVSAQPVPYAPPEQDFITKIVTCLGVAGGREGVTQCDHMPPEPPVLLEWMDKNKKP